MTRSAAVEVCHSIGGRDYVITGTAYPGSRGWTWERGTDPEVTFESVTDEETGIAEDYDEWLVAQAPDKDERRNLERDLANAAIEKLADDDRDREPPVREYDKYDRLERDSF